MSKAPDKFAIDCCDMALKVHSTILAVELQNDKWANVVYIANMGRLVEIFAWAYRPKTESRNSEPKVANGLLMSKDIFMACMNYVSSVVVPWFNEREVENNNLPDFVVSEQVFDDPMIVVSGTYIIPKKNQGENEARGVRLVNFVKYAKTSSGHKYQTSASISFNRVNLDRLMASYDEICKKLSSKGTVEPTAGSKKRALDGPPPTPKKNKKAIEQFPDEEGDVVVVDNADDRSLS